MMTSKATGLRSRSASISAAKVFHVFLAVFDHRELQRQPDLGCGQANSRGVVHGFAHGGDQFLGAGQQNFLGPQWPRAPPQHRFSGRSDLQDHFVPSAREASAVRSSGANSPARNLGHAAAAIMAALSVERATEGKAIGSPRCSASCGEARPQFTVGRDAARNQDTFRAQRLGSLKGLSLEIFDHGTLK